MKASFKRLFLDTATKSIYLCLLDGERVLETVYQEGMNDHSVTLFPTLEAMLSNHQLQLKDLDEIIVGIGPGSYTGVRIGVSVVKMIGYALPNIRIFAVSSLALLASSSSKEWILASMDARRGNAFMAYYKQEQGRFTPLIQDCLEEKTTIESQIDPQADIVTSGIPNPISILQSGLIKEVIDIHTLTPNYLQATEAEKKQGEQHGDHH